MRISVRLLAFGLGAVAGPLCAQPAVRVDRNVFDKGFRFESTPPPAVNDAAAGAKIAVVGGKPDPNSASSSVLVDGALPEGADEPAANFFFEGENGGRLLFDLGVAIPVARVSTYSWHSAGRGPQAYTLYGAQGTEKDFVKEPGTDPAADGWTRIAEVNSAPDSGETGGQYGATVSGEGKAALGDYRYLLFDIAKGVPGDPFGNTFYSEIDVVDANGPALETVKVPEKVTKEFRTPGGEYVFLVDATAAPDLLPWVGKEMMPVVLEWYPKIVDMLASPGFDGRRNILVELKEDAKGNAAYALPGRIVLGIPFLRGQLDEQAKGAVVHEFVHIAQDYWSVPRTASGGPPPGWVSEGIADYIRWFLYEPEAKGAEITERNFEKANYDSSYRITANFLDWVIGKYDRDLLRDLNAAARAGRYSDDLWKTWTGKSLDQLNDEWKAENARRLGISPKS